MSINDAFRIINEAFGDVNEAFEEQKNSTERYKWAVFDTRIWNPTSKFPAWRCRVHSILQKQIVKKQE